MVGVCVVFGGIPPPPTYILTGLSKPATARRRDYLSPIGDSEFFIVAIQ
jgi:hypothetical protein